MERIYSPGSYFFSFRVDSVLERGEWWVGDVKTNLTVLPALKYIQPP